MPTLAGRLGLFGLALGLSLLSGGAPCVTAEEAVDSTSHPDLKPAQAAPTGDQAIPPSSEHAAGKQTASDSHRRRTLEPHASTKSSRRTHGMSTVTELPIERLRQAATRDVNVHAPPTDHSTLAEVMRRLAGWTDSCPVCGKSCPLCGRPPLDQNLDQDLPDAVVLPKPLTNDQVLGHIGGEDARDESLSRPLRAGEPAQVILDTQRRLGKSVLDGTEFGGSPELLIQWIRALDEENRRQQAMLEEVSRADVDEADEDAPAVTGQSQIEALRNACRQLLEAAELLEEQNLFESADSVREIADELREQSREKVGALEARRTTP